MTVMKYQNDRCSKWPLSKMTVNLAPKWPLCQNDRYFTLKWPLFHTKWPLFCTKWPLFFVFSTTVILNILKWPLIWKNLDQIDRYFKPKWPLTTKMTVISKNDRYFSPKWPLWFPNMTVISPNRINSHFGTDNNPKWPLWDQNDRYLKWAGLGLTST